VTTETTILPEVRTTQPVAPASAAREAANGRRGGGLRFAIVFVGTFLLSWSALIAVHWIGNPDGVFHSSHKTIKREMSWKVRTFERHAKQNLAPTILVLGSSRMMQVSPPQLEKILGGGRAFNFAAPGSSPVDMLAQLRFALAKGGRPTHVLIGIDDQGMFGLYDETHGVRIFQAWDVFRKLPLREQLRVIARVPAQVKPELTWTALQLLRQSPSPPRNKVPTSNAVVMEDGYIVYPKRELGIRDGTYRLLADLKVKLNTRKSMPPLYPDGARVSERHMKYLKMLLELCRRNGIQVTVVLTPVMPQSDAITLRPADRQARGVLDRRLQELCRQAKVRYKNLTNIRAFHGEQWGFWDEWHLTAPNMVKLVNVAYGRDPDDFVNELPTDLDRIARPTRVNTTNTW
jgi:hypothetical protein